VPLSPPAAAACRCRCRRLLERAAALTRCMAIHVQDIIKDMDAAAVKAHLQPPSQGGGRLGCGFDLRLSVGSCKPTGKGREMAEPSLAP